MYVYLFITAQIFKLLLRSFFRYIMQRMAFTAFVYRRFFAICFCKYALRGVIGKAQLRIVRFRHTSAEANIINACHIAVSPFKTSPAIHSPMCSAVNLAHAIAQHIGNDKISRFFSNNLQRLPPAKSYSVKKRLHVLTVINRNESNSAQPYLSLKVRYSVRKRSSSDSNSENLFSYAALYFLDIYMQTKNAKHETKAYDFPIYI